MLKIKVCGMKFHENIKNLINLYPDYIGFIFYEKSKRFVGESLEEFYFANFPKKIKRVGVFVNSTVENILLQSEKYSLDFVQLHGNETPDFCKKVKNEGIKIIKAFQINQEFDFKKCEAYLDECEFFLFDTKTAHYGGSGKKFDWSLLNNYKSSKAFFLSGGIKLEDTDELLKIENKNFYAIDVNSGFEEYEGFKNIKNLELFFQKLK